MRLLTPFSFQVELRHLAFISHQVPAERVRKGLPKQFELETFRSEDGKEYALISVGCFRNHDFRWSLTQFPRLGFEQVTYRTYVRHRGRIGVYFFGTVLSKLLPFIMQRSLAKQAFSGMFRVSRRADSFGYKSYECDIKSDFSNLKFRLVANGKDDSVEALKPRSPFLNGIELAQQTTYRLHGFFKSPLGFHVDQFVLHRPMRPWFGELVEGRFDLWENLGFLTREESQHPLLVTVEPEITFNFFPPLPCSLLALKRLSLEHLLALSPKLAA
ncbi:MAG: DUF2071 domain-containing protein [Bdellovibrionota bacterium]